MLLRSFLLPPHDPEGQPGPPRERDARKPRSGGEKAKRRSRAARWEKTAPRCPPKPFPRGRESDLGRQLSGAPTEVTGLGLRWESFPWAGRSPRRFRGAPCSLSPHPRPGLQPGCTLSPPPQELRSKRTYPGPVPVYLRKPETLLQLGRERGCGTPGLVVPTPLSIPCPSLEAPYRKVKSFDFRGLGRMCVCIGGGTGCDSGRSLGMQSREE